MKRLLTLTFLFIGCSSYACNRKIVVRQNSVAPIHSKTDKPEEEHKAELFEYEEDF